MSLIDHIHRCQNADMGKFLPWQVGEHRAGWVRRDLARPCQDSTSPNRIDLVSTTLEHLRHALQNPDGDSRVFASSGDVIEPHGFVVDSASFGHKVALYS